MGIRRKNSIVKAILAVPVLYFSVVGLVVTISGRGIPDSDDLAIAGINKREAPIHDENDPMDEQFHNLNNNGHHQWGKNTQRPPFKHEDPLIPPFDSHVDDLDIRKQLQENDAKRHELRKQREEMEQERFVNDQQVIQRPGEGLGEDGRKAADPNVFVPTKPADYNPKAPGELGKAVDIDKEKLSKEERKKFDQGWTRNAFNQYASDMISMHRTLPDIRDNECKKVPYPKNTELPDTTVVIIFHNEAWSVLLRTVNSVLDRSPPHLIREVLLVDDFSDFEHLGKQLEDYVATTYTKVKVLRAKKREGLIRARLRGASVAKGKVITFLDSHCECTEGWLEPLLARIAEDKSNVVCPVIDVIDDQTLRYQFSSAKSTSVGGFDWNLQFNWHAIPDKEKKRRSSDIEPVRSPTMAGGLFSISREYFEYLGTYDPGMDIWGGENLELSFRIWMCGGSLEIVPCSHVGHIFRKRSPYSWKTGVNVVKKNSIRLAEVWMDEYKHYYYERFNNDLGDFGDVSMRKALRERLNCRSFNWYIENIFPDLFVPGEAIASGEVRNKVKDICLDSGPPAKKELIAYPCHKTGGSQIRNKVQSQCLDSPVDSHSMQKPIKMWPCHRQGGNQYWMLSKGGEIRRDEGCMDYAGQFVMIYPCHGMKGNQEWVYGPDNSLRHRNTNLCMELTEDGQKVEMKSCSGIDRQIWYWQRRTPDHGTKKPHR